MPRSAIVEDEVLKKAVKVKLSQAYRLEYQEYATQCLIRVLVSQGSTEDHPPYAFETKECTASSVATNGEQLPDC